MLAEPGGTSVPAGPGAAGSLGRWRIAAASGNVTGGGAGGGYFGGGGGGASTATASSGGGGGSSFTTPGATGVTHTQGNRAGNGQVVITW